MKELRKRMVRLEKNQAMTLFRINELLPLEQVATETMPRSPPARPPTPPVAPTGSVTEQWVHVRKDVCLLIRVAWATEPRQYDCLPLLRSGMHKFNCCERCQARSDHMMTCIPRSACFYCKQRGRASESTTHHSAYCSHYFDM
ncbi:hypothetical protein Y032_0568g61 [Ancylostoma ceylanicum]|uniref:Uncharacterized protein n=1 Tax=Ancylostoma ceylanicum TaxID=53326 RepID=A0A016WPF5_9BILA|nr:hypothetical protein Y032_0568g61 [Ancylostoma ceylanicum]